jgi:hypothetical protein
MNVTANCHITFQFKNRSVYIVLFIITYTRINLSLFPRHTSGIVYRSTLYVFIENFKPSDYIAHQLFIKRANSATCFGSYYSHLQASHERWNRSLNTALHWLWLTLVFYNVWYVLKTTSFNTRQQIQPFVCSPLTIQPNTEGQSPKTQRLRENTSHGFCSNL